MNKLSLKIGSLITTLMCLPLLAKAQLVASGGTDLFDLLNWAESILKRAPQYLVFAAVIVFFYNIVKYVVSGDAADKKAEALKGVGWSIAGIFIMLSLWGIIAFLSGTLGIGQGATITAPLIPNVDLPDAF